MSGGEAWYNTRVPDADPDDKGYYSTRRSPVGGSTDDDGDDEGEYECLVCEYQTDINNEHAQQVRHWCQGECNEIQPFTRIDE